MSTKHGTTEKLAPSDPRKIQGNDVLCGVLSPPYSTHVGNRRYAILVSGYLATHPPIEIVQDRVRAAVEIVGRVRSVQRGRFLARTKRGPWKDIGDRLAIRWVSLHLKRVRILEQQQQEQEQERRRASNESSPLAVATTNINGRGQEEELGQQRHTGDDDEMESSDEIHVRAANSATTIGVDSLIAICQTKLSIDDASRANP
mmetsp:Transcript_13076/g.22224  ORF Transcript_13076/g.22224 Transcript_13076/m.22224 type:complete len:202 (-) Transcript_13076:416-1021(-)